MPDTHRQPVISRLAIRAARRQDLPVIVQLLADDALGSSRESPETPLPESYYMAFAAIEQDANNELIVAELDGAVAAVLQLTFIPCLTYRGSWRALIESVRVAATLRSQGIGQCLIEWSIARARQKNCRMVQLTTNKVRADAIRFYQRLGFVASHEGMKFFVS